MTTAYKSRAVRAAILFAALFLSVAWAQAGTVRGVLLHQNQSRASGIAVRVTSPQMGPSGFGYSGADGMYYLLNIPPGNYTLEVFITNEYVLRFPLVVNGPMVDFPPVKVP